MPFQHNDKSASCCILRHYIFHSSPSSTEEMPLLLPSNCRRWAKTTDELLQRGADPNAADSDGVTPLQIAAKYGHPEVVKLLLAANAKVNAPITCEDTPLRYASANGHAEVVKLLLAANAEVDCPRGAPLYFASAGGHVEAVKLLLAANAEVNGGLGVRVHILAVSDLLREKGSVLPSLHFGSWGPHILVSS